MKDGRLLKKDSPSWSYVFRKRASGFDLCVKSGCSPKARLPRFGSQAKKKFPHKNISLGSHDLYEKCLEVSGSLAEKRLDFGEIKMYTHWGDPDADGRIILRWIFVKWEGVETGWSWLRTGTDCGHL